MFKKLIKNVIGSNKTSTTCMIGADVGMSGVWADIPCHVLSDGTVVSEFSDRQDRWELLDDIMPTRLDGTKMFERSSLELFLRIAASRINNELYNRLTEDQKFDIFSDYVQLILIPMFNKCENVSDEDMKILIDVLSMNVCNYLENLLRETI